jgi:hypothetical protein
MQQPPTTCCIDISVAVAVAGMALGFDTQLPSFQKA